MKFFIQNYSKKDASSLNGNMPSNTWAKICLIFILLINSTLISFAGSGNISKPASAKSYDYFSFYHKTRDSVYLAVDVFLPKLLQPTANVPTVLYLTRYVRSVQLKAPFKWLKESMLAQISEEEIRFFTSNGYACVIIDARGSGASSGVRQADFSPDEILDAAEIMDWITHQHWSNGRIGTTGISYVGTTAELMLSTQHPALKACIPRSSIFDLYADITHPGGIRQEPFLDVWDYTTRSLDNNNFSWVGLTAKVAVKGINPVDGDKKGDYLKTILSGRQSNYSVAGAMKSINFRNDIQPDIKLPIDTFSVHKNIPKIAASNIPILRIGGWYDGALATSAIKGFINLPNTETVVLGPWDHGPFCNASPYALKPDIKEDIYGIMLRFFDQYLKDSSSDKAPQKSRQFIYYQVGEERWDTSSVWPIPHQNQIFYLGNEHQLNNKNDDNQTSVIYNIDYSTGTSGGSRWNSLTKAYRYDKFTRYPDRAAQTAKNLSFDTQPLAQNLPLAGHPSLHIQLKTDAPEAHVFVYLDEIAPDGTVRYITEGMLQLGFNRASDNHTYQYPGVNPYFVNSEYLPIQPGQWNTYTIDFLPIAYTIPAGHQLRISIAGADKDHFALPVQKPYQFQISLGGENGSALYIPVKISN